MRHTASFFSSEVLRALATPHPMLLEVSLASFSSLRLVFYLVRSEAFFDYYGGSEVPWPRQQGQKNA